MRPPMLSKFINVGYGYGWFNGKGTYALKLASRPQSGAIATSIKRQTFRHRGQIQLECYFTFKPEASELRLSLHDVRAFVYCLTFRMALMPNIAGCRICDI